MKAVILLTTLLCASYVYGAAVESPETDPVPAVGSVESDPVPSSASDESGQDDGPAPVTSRPNNIDFEKASKMYLHSLQKMMPCGYAELEIPPLAPYKNKLYSYNFEKNNFQANGSFSNLVLSGLNIWELLDYSYDDESTLLTYDINMPALQLLSEFASHLMINIADYPINIDGEGIVNFKIVDLRAVGSLNFGPIPDKEKGLQITNFDLKFFVGDIAVKNWNNLWNIAINNFANDWQREFLLMWAEQVQPFVNDFYNQNVIPVLNSVLADTTMEEVIDFYVKTSETFNKVHCHKHLD
ncbi:uncharacterized protein LOC119680258 [Teleopsis dalmanni]|uniref:uncharacterized protein LOC119680258 n=1 Tax=Teleopsis dalmanni TaxID=139649 RepID=UPI0018CDAECC|nr:uncharacterized protein LOC119680258 [Teleopsis dalmanni]